MNEYDMRKERLRKIIRSLGAAEPPPPLAPEAYERAAIVTTVRGVAGTSLAAWCSYHLAIGFACLFVYFDDPDELIHFDDARIQCIAVDEALEAAWTRLGPPAHEWLTFAHSEVQARQSLNALHALSMCVGSCTVAWLMHMDADELFFLPTLDCRAHFRHLGERGVHALTYANLEAVPETDFERCSTAVATSITMPFSHVSLFKRNPRLLPDTPAAHAAVEHWRSRSSATATSSFHYYANGKSVVRVSARARPLSVHEWIPGSAAGLSCWYSCVGAGDLVQPWPTAAYGDWPAILHYACCSSHALWQRQRSGSSRYRLRGVLSAPPIYVHTALAAGSERPRDGILEEEQLMEWDEVEEEEDEEIGDSEEVPAEDAEAKRRVEEVFEARVVLRDVAEAERQLAAGVCVRVVLPPTLFGVKLGPNSGGY